ncbi:MAG: phosphoglycerate dehydrogenase [Spirochaetota bacterium]
MKKKILITDDIAPEGLQLLQSNPDFDIVYKPGLQAAALKKEITDAHALIIRSATHVTADVIEEAKALEIIARAGIGVDNVDVEAATSKGIIVTNAPGGNTISTAEFALSLICSLARNIPQADASMKKQLWEKTKFEGIELRRKVIGIIGLGRVGAELAKLCKALGMQVVGFDPYLAREKLAAMDIDIADLETIWKKADLISVHTPLTDETKNLINADVIKKLKPTVRIVNCARGGIVNEQDLYKALKEKRIAGAALDVFTQEPPETLPPFHELDNVILTPHLGAYTYEAQVSVAIEASQTVIDYFTRGAIHDSVNYPSVDMQQYDFLKPFINLAERMGKFQAIMLAGKVRSVQLYYSGEFGKYSSAPLTAAYLKGLLSPYIDRPINYVNATMIAAERGIKVHVGESTQSGDWAHLVQANAEGGTLNNELWGTVIAKQPWVVRCDEYLIDFIPSGKMLVMHNNDVPNVIGAIGTFLGKNHINIANLHLARTRRGGKALVILEIDEEIPADVLEKLSKLPEILDVKYVVV